MAINKGPLDINSFIKKIDNFCEKHKCNVISCPIGLASGHEDNIILKNISLLLHEFIFWFTFKE